MNIQTFCNWRFIKKTKWNMKILIKHSTSSLQSRTRIKKERCAFFNCNHSCLTQLKWTDNTEREFVPWCAAHIDNYILTNIEIYCIGGLDIHGNSFF